MAFAVCNTAAAAAAAAAAAQKGLLLSLMRWKPNDDSWRLTAGKKALVWNSRLGTGFVLFLFFFLGWKKNICYTAALLLHCTVALLLHCTVALLVVPVTQRLNITTSLGLYTTRASYALPS